MKHNNLILNINKSLWLFALSFLISMLGLQAQNTIWSLPPNYIEHTIFGPVSQSLPQGIPSSLDYQGQVVCNAPLYVSL